MECFGLLLEHLAWIEHQLLSGIKDSRKAGSLWGMMRGVGGVRKSIHQSWLEKGLGLGLLCWGFKGVQEEIPSEEVSTLQIGSVAFPPGQCTREKWHPLYSMTRCIIVLKWLHHQTNFLLIEWENYPESQSTQNFVLGLYKQKDTRI